MLKIIIFILNVVVLKLITKFKSFNRVLSPATFKFELLVTINVEVASFLNRNCFINSEKKYKNIYDLKINFSYILTNNLIFIKQN